VSAAIFFLQNWVLHERTFLCAREQRLVVTLQSGSAHIIHASLSGERPSRRKKGEAENCTEISALKIYGKT
jgi:hypothetical protein